MKLLLNKIQALQYLDLVIGCENLRYEKYVISEQKLTLKRWLGDELMFDVLAAVDTFGVIINTKFEVLINGGKWGEKQYCEGLRIVLAHLAYAEYVVMNNYTDTPFGIKIKNFQDGLPTPPEALEKIRTRMKDRAEAYFESVKKYLCSNKHIFPNFLKVCKCEDYMQADFKATKSIRARTIYNDSCNNNNDCKCITCEERRII